MEAEFVKLENTIESIDGKIKQGTAKARQYKETILEKLRELQEKINMFAEEAKKSPVPELRQKLLESQEALATKTEEFNNAKRQLDEINSRLANLGKTIEELQGKINADNDKLRQLEELQGANTTKDAEITALKTQIDELNNQKSQAQDNLATSQSQLGEFVSRIAAINGRLIEEIAKIDSMLNNLDDNTDIDLQIKSIGDTLTSIVNIINNPEQRGGRRKTKKHKKMRGGYLYSKKSNSNSSSMNNSSRSNSNFKSNSKSRRKKRLLNF